METVNRELQLADEFLRHTDCNIFLTGKAGTGKTTFLKNIKKTSPKRMVVAAPTGVAAINAGGVTLHSFFQMPFGPYVPGSENYNHSNRHRFNKEKVNIIKSLDLLVIDEISMVRADLLDCIDAVLRRYRRSNTPFGGVQLLMIGDLYQLPPVVKEAEWQILQQYYDTAFFFSSNALRQTEVISLELRYIYRQSDHRFIEILNDVRQNTLDASSLAELNRRHIADFSADEKEGYITLCTHNRRADAINFSRLQEISSKSYDFDAEIEGNFPEHTYPTSASLELKIGAQVMFVRNDLSHEKRYFNGKIGKVTAIDGDKIWVQCPGENNRIIVEPIIWENIEYTLDQQNSEINANIIGTFSQYPLRLAWAITIHKSQGLTFDRAVIDAEAAFVHGQVYVALSRCRTLEGLVLSSPLPAHVMKTDPAVISFSNRADQGLAGAEKLAAAKIDYQQRLILECFDFKGLRISLSKLTRAIAQNRDLLQISGIGDTDELEKEVFSNIYTIGENFKRQLRGLYKDTVLPGDDPIILERLSKASDYFTGKLESIVASALHAINFETDNKEIRKKIRDGLKRAKEECVVKLAAVQCCRAGFSPVDYLRSLSNAEIAFRQKKDKTVAVTYSEADITHPELFERLRKWRTAKATSENIAPFQVLHQKTLVQITIHLPDNPSALLKVKGIGKCLSERYGTEIIAIVSEYRKCNNIEEVVLPEPDKKQVEILPEQKSLPKKKTRDISLELFESGLSLAEIAHQRSLTLPTIEGHLAFFVASGRVSIEKLLPDDTVATIAETIRSVNDGSFSKIKAALGNDHTYGDIKFVHSHLRYLTDQKE